MEYQSKKKRKVCRIELLENLSVEAVKEFLAQHSLSVNTIFTQNATTGKTDTTLLHNAVNKQNVELIDWILTHEVDTNFEVFGEGSPIHVAIKQGNLNTVQKLVSCGANLNFRDSKIGNTPLGVAITHKKDLILKYLIENGADVNLLPFKRFDLYRRQSLLQIYFEKSDIEMMKLLLSKGANVNQKLSIGHSFLTCAAQSGNLELLKVLIDGGANINCIYETFYDVVSPLHAAIVSKNVEVVEFFCNLDEPATDVNILRGKKKQPILHYALEKPQYSDKTIECLLVAGADINFEDCNGKMAIDICQQYDKDQDYILEKHLVKLLSANLPVVKRNKDKIKGKWASFFAECRKEVIKMKRTKIGDVNIRFYDILHLSIFCLINRVKCIEIDYNLVDHKEKLCEMFPLYGKMLAYKLAKAQRRLKRGLRAEEEIMKIFVCLGLPYDLCKEMFRYLNNKDFKKIIGEKTFD